MVTRQTLLCIPGSGCVFLGKGWIPQGLFPKRIGGDHNTGLTTINTVVEGEELWLSPWIRQQFVLCCISGGNFCIGLSLMDLIQPHESATPGLGGRPACPLWFSPAV